MTRALQVVDAGPGITVQDAGRRGYLAFGVGRGGAVDRLALAEGAALLGQPITHAALEIAGLGGRFKASGEALRIALTGAPMRASIDDVPVVWNASHLLRPDQVLHLAAAGRGVYGYLHVGGGFATPVMLGARATHLSARLGQPVQPGDILPVGSDRGARTGRVLDVEDRFAGGAVRLVASLQTDRFSQAERARFAATAFRRDTRGNRMGVRLVQDGAGFGTDGALNVLSEVISPGDIQITGDGTPFVLLAECQTTGGYPRIGTVLPQDLPRVAQAPPGAALQFGFVTLEDALDAHAAHARSLGDLPRRIRDLVRDPHDIADLLSYQLISGATAGQDENA